MAIDGIGIIDSDSAFDIHNFIVEGWKDGRSAIDLANEVHSWEADFCFSPLDTEIYWTAFAFSLWKIGEPSNEVRVRMLEVIEQGASTAWLDIDTGAQKLRQKQLDRLVLKLQSPNPRPLRRPARPSVPREPLFSRGDVLAVALPSGQHGACLLVELEISPRKIEYNFAIVHLFQPATPTAQDVSESHIAFEPATDRIPAGGFHASCWTNQKVVAGLREHLTVIGHVELGEARMLSYAPAVSGEKFFGCWEGINVVRDLHPVLTCLAPIVPVDN